MPRVYRTMKGEGNPLQPVLGDSATKLGVREKDLAPDEAGNAEPGRGGMSVIPSIAALRRRVAKSIFSPTMVPQRLAEQGIVPGAIGSNTLYVFRTGEGPFEMGLLTERLALVPDHADHGTIQPAFVMPYGDYRQAIAATREQWVVGERDE